MIRFETSGAIARITLDTPETSNKFTYQLMNDFIDALASAATSGAVVLLLGATGEHFTLGRDQSEKLPLIDKRDNLGLILRANAQLRAFPGISIALIQGRAMGFGSGLALHSDISIAGESATLGFDEIKHGLAPLVVLTYLADHVGQKTAKELVFTGRDVAAQEALRIGLVNRVVADIDLTEAGETLTRDIAGFSHGALRLMHQFSQDLPGLQEDAAQVAIKRLVQWIEAGKP